MRRVQMVADDGHTPNEAMYQSTHPGQGQTTEQQDQTARFRHFG